eukprot:3483451-Pyramimonas_sp.AAC.2
MASPLIIRCTPRFAAGVFTRPNLPLPPDHRPARPVVQLATHRRARKRVSAPRGLVRLVNLWNIPLADSFHWSSQEVIGAPGEAVQPDQYFSTGLVTDFGFANAVGSAFKQGGSLRSLSTLDDGSLMPQHQAVTLYVRSVNDTGQLVLSPASVSTVEFCTYFMSAAYGVLI